MRNHSAFHKSEIYHLALVWRWVEKERVNFLPHGPVSLKSAYRAPQHFCLVAEVRQQKSP